ncbi:MAG: tyrosine-type recombinase/integrase [Bacteroidales bacterium]|jgi:integrase/recombinase XerD|nr:tyrosine-type recombinase/integrase [Bacteroidales bacterium]MDD4702712.1 tyrosine-type recombinase/integrase [Bacteroidales bacterium]MDX9797264.1 tyrosine-type recombinase/integrase [Bacteroidales bacterium]
MWRSFIKGFNSYLTLERGFSPNTKEAYLRDCDRLFSFLEENYPSITPKTLTYKHLQAFLKSIQTSERDNEYKLLTISSQKRLVSGIRAFYKYLLIEDVVDSDPTELIELPRLDAKLPVVLSNEEIIKMIESIDKSTYRGAWTNLMLEILYGAGLRISELLNLQLSDIYQEQELLKVIGKGDKERWVPLNKIAFRQLDFFLKTTRTQIKPMRGCENFVFLNQRGGHLTRIAAFQAIKEIAQRAGIEKNIHPHTFRHSFATELMLAGADIMVVRELMGHASVRSTEIYTHLNTTHLRETLLLYHPLYNKG